MIQVRVRLPAAAIWEREVAAGSFSPRNHAMKAIFAVLLILAPTLLLAADPLAVLVENKLGAYLLEIDAAGVVRISPLAKVVRVGNQPDQPTDGGTGSRS